MARRVVSQAGEEEQPKRRGLSRRTVLVGGGVGVGLALAWGFWPRRYSHNLVAGEGEQVFNAFIKIGTNGRVVVALPQAELGQGVATALPQIVADELGADWRTIGVEPAPLSPLYANLFLANELSEGALPTWLEGVRDWTAREVATREALMLTGGSTSIRAFEAPMRQAAATARALLQMVAADHWGADWTSLEAYGGFVRRGEEGIAFGELAERAAALTPPSNVTLRSGDAQRLVGQPLPRLDAPGKVDGSALFAADIRLPDMVYASAQSAPAGGWLTSADEEAAARIREALAVFRNPDWIGVAALNSWAADRALAALRASFEVPVPRPNLGSIEQVLDQALDGSSMTRIIARGDVDAALTGTGPSVRYRVDMAASLPPETLTATARVTRDAIEAWVPTQAPGLVRTAIATATGVTENKVIVYPVLSIGGGYGRKLEMDAAVQAAIMAQHLGRPVQLTWSRLQDIRHDRPRPPAMGALEARLAANGTVGAWRARISAPATAAEVAQRIGLSTRLYGGAKAPIAGALPPYGIPAVGIDYAEARIGFATGSWRSEAHSYTCFFTESFIDELARGFGLEPLSFRMQMLGDNPRLARCLQTVGASGGWDGGPRGSGMGIAAFSGYGSHIATLVEVEVADDQTIRVLRAVCAVDCGRVINPDLVKQQIEGGLIHGITAATTPAVNLSGGTITQRTLADFALPRLADLPDVRVEIVDSDEASGGVTELAVPTAGPAMANAIHSLTGQRLRRLPLRIGEGQATGTR